MSYGPNREAGGSARAAGPGLAGDQRLAGVRPLVRRPRRRAVRCRDFGDRNDHRDDRRRRGRRDTATPRRGDGHLADRRRGTAAPIRLPLASVRGRTRRRPRKRNPSTLVEFTLSRGARRGAAAPSSSPGSTPSPRRGGRSAFEANSQGWAHADRVGAQVPVAGAAGVTATLAAAPLFDALGDPNRLRIVVRLCDGGPSSTSQVTQAVSITRQAATKHLRTAGGGRSGGKQPARPRPHLDIADAAADRCGRLPQQLSHRWDAAIERLRAYVED